MGFTSIDASTVRLSPSVPHSPLRRSPLGDRPPVCSLGFYASPAFCPRLNYAAYCVCMRGNVSSGRRRGKRMRRPPDRRVKGEGGGSVAVAARRHVQSPFSLIAAVHVAPKVSSERASERVERDKRGERRRKERRRINYVSQSVGEANHSARERTSERGGARASRQRACQDSATCTWTSASEWSSEEGGNQGARGDQQTAERAQGIGERLVSFVSLAWRCGGVSSLHPLRDHPRPSRPAAAEPGLGVGCGGRIMRTREPACLRARGPSVRLARF